MARKANKSGEAEAVVMPQSLEPADLAKQMLHDALSRINAMGLHVAVRLPGQAELLRIEEVGSKGFIPVEPEYFEVRSKVMDLEHDKLEQKIILSWIAHVIEESASNHEKMDLNYPLLYTLAQEGLRNPNRREVLKRAPDWLRRTWPAYFGELGINADPLGHDQPRGGPEHPTPTQAQLPVG